LVFVLPLILWSNAALGATILVPSEEHPTIQAGIDAANSGDTVLVADGTYTGAGNKDLDFGGKAITVRSKNGPEYCIIDCEEDGTGFYFYSEEGINSVLSGFTVMNGSSGGIYCDSSSPTITDCNISGNSAEWYGGGIFCYSSSPEITNCTISGNTAEESGGGIYCLNSSPTITNCIFWGNTATAGSEIYGEYSNPTVTYSDVQGGYTGDGNIDADPKFVGGGNYHLQPGSPCIDAGISTNAPAQDFEGDDRFDDPDTPNTGGGGDITYYDIGADEYLGAAGPGDELAVDFGSAYGLWHYGSDWTNISSLDADGLENFDGDLAADFGSTYGLWIYDGSWTKISTLDAEGLECYDGGLAADFGTTYGLWHYDNGWTKISTLDAEGLEEYGIDYLAADFGSSYGLWIYDGTWTKISSLDAEDMVGPDFGLFVDFGATYGLWKYDGGWTKISSLDAQGLQDFDGYIAADFGSSYGLWIYDGTWTKISSLDAEDMLGVGTDLYVDFGSTYGLWIYDGTWTKISSLDAQDMVDVDLN
jgi:parallel beta-helix repeat protein